MAKWLGHVLVLHAALWVHYTPADDLHGVMEEQLVAGDECHIGGVSNGDCAMHALQQRGSKLAANGTSQAQTSLARAAVPPSEPDAKEYGQVPLEDLGADELIRMIAKATKVLGDRQVLSSGLASSRSSERTACPDRKYDGPKGSSEHCFAQLAQNSAHLEDDTCACPQGCNLDSIIWRHGQTVTFKNTARAVGCQPSTVLLTVPHSFYRDPSDLKRSCASGVVSLLAAMLTDGWDTYQTVVSTGPVKQCFHNPEVASVKYVHLQTFCPGGSFHQMPTGDQKNDVGFCVTMSSRSEADSLAARLAAWS